MEKHLQQFLLKADSKALATVSKDGVVNVIPVSSVKIINDKIVLVNYFMEKTLSNLLDNKLVSLVAWSQMIGYQLKGPAEYLTSGPVFAEVVEWVKLTLPDRLVKGVIVITPTDIYDISPSKNSDQSLVGS